MLHNKRIFRFILTAALCLCWAAPALAATTDYSAGTYDNVVGNPTNPGDPTGIGGVNGFPGANNANASGNTVNVTGGTVNTFILGGRYSTDQGVDTTANNNTVNIESSFGGNASLSVYGGWAEVQGVGGYAGKTATVSGNTVNIYGGQFAEIFGGSAISNDGPATARNNTVNFTHGAVGNIYGGSAWISTPASTYAPLASGNSVIINGGTVTGTVYGG
jgi:hypothetical protein